MDLSLDIENDKIDYLPLLLAHPKYIPSCLQFIDQQVATVLLSIYNVSRKKEAIDPEKLLSCIKNPRVKALFEEAYATPSSDIALLKEFIKTEQRLTYEFELRKLFDSGKSLDPDEIKALYKKIVTIKDEVAETEFQISDVNDMFEILNRIDEDSKIGFIPSGFTEINDNIAGGYKKGSTICWLGVSGAGKTTWMCNEAAMMWHSGKYSVLYITTEMNEKAIYDRILRSAFNRTTDKLNDSFTLIKINNSYIWKPIKVIKVHPNDVTCDDIQEKIDELGWKPDVIIIDYFDYIKASEKTSSEYDKHGIVATDMQKLAEVNECPVVTATQANRSALDSEGGGSKEVISAVHIGDSYKKVRALDVLLCIVQPAALKAANKYELYLDKNRYGPSNKTIGYFTIDWTTMKITTDSNPKQLKQKSDPKDLDKFEEKQQEDRRQQQIAKEEDPTLKKYIESYNGSESVAEYVNKKSTLKTQGDKNALRKALNIIKGDNKWLLKD